MSGGGETLSVYSLDEGATHFAAAVAFLDKCPDCASDDQVSEFLVSYTLLLNLSAQRKAIIELVERYLPCFPSSEEQAG